MSADDADPPPAGDLAVVERYYRGLERQAYHEAGHAIAGSLMGRSVDLIEINLPRNPTQVLGQVTFTPAELRPRRELVIAVSGPIAEVARS